MAQDFRLFAERVAQLAAREEEVAKSRKDLEVRDRTVKQALRQLETDQEALNAQARQIEAEQQAGALMPKERLTCTRR